jgi:hypothetical protein
MFMNRLEQKAAIMATASWLATPKPESRLREKMVFIITARLLVALHSFCNSAQYNYQLG